MSAIFHDLQVKIDDDARVRDALKLILQSLDRHDRQAQSVLSRIHSTPMTQRTFSTSPYMYIYIYMYISKIPHHSNSLPPVQPVLDAVTTVIADEVATVQQLAHAASQEPYFKYNALWARDVQNVIFVVLLSGWLGAQPVPDIPSAVGTLWTIEQVGTILQGMSRHKSLPPPLHSISHSQPAVPVNLKDRDAFHISIEEYLHALISLVEELARLAINAVTLGDYARPLAISRFVKDVHAGFQILNLKNDALRRRSDSIKYNVKKIEDIVYDLSLRNLLPRE